MPLVQFVAALLVSQAATHQVHLGDLDRFSVRVDGSVLTGQALARLPQGLALPAQLEVTVSHRSGNSVGLVQRINGVRVVGASASAQLNSRGELHSLTHRFATIDTNALALPQLSQADATALAFSSAGGAAWSSPRASELVILAGARPRYAYEVLVMHWAHPETPLKATIDARTGELLSTVDLRQTATFDANVYMTNPIENPTLQAKTFTSDTTSLKNTRVETRGCKSASVDDLTFIVTPLTASIKQSLESYFGKSFNHAVVALCGEAPTAVPADADTYAPAPGFEDKFSEVNFFYHADQVADYFASDFPGYPGRPRLPGTVNFRTPSQFAIACASERYAGPTPTGLNNAAVQAAAKEAFKTRSQGDLAIFGQPLCSGLSTGANPTDADFAEFANAFFMPALDPDILPPEYAALGFLRDYDSMVFGQSGTADFAYDGNVVYHEYTHSVVKDVAALQDGTAVTEFGPDTAPGAMNEGLSDYFAAVLSGDACIGELTAAALTDQTCLRDLSTTTKRCPEDIVGEVHTDSEPFSAALWAARTAFGEQAKTFDRAVFAALRRAGPQPTFADFASYLQDEATSLGLSAATLRTALDQHNVLSCEYVLPLVEKAKSGALVVPAREAQHGDFMPGYMQYKLEVPPLTKSIEVSFTVVQSQGGGFGDFLGGSSEDPFELIAVLKKGERIAFGSRANVNYALDNKAVSVTYSGEGPYREELELNDKEGGTYHLVLGNPSATARTVRNISWQVRDELPEEKPDTGNTGGGSTGGSTGKTNGSPQNEPLLSGTNNKKSGCSSTAGSPSGFALLTGFAVLTLLWVSKRKNGATGED